MGSKRFSSNSSKGASPGVGVANRQARGEDHAVTIVCANYHTDVRRDVQLQIVTKACAPYDLTLMAISRHAHCACGAQIASSSADSSWIPVERRPG